MCYVYFMFGGLGVCKCIYIYTCIYTHINRGSGFDCSGLGVQGFQRCVWSV